MGKLIPLFIALIGLLGGAGAGYFLRPAPEALEMASGEHSADSTATDHGAQPQRGAPTQDAEPIPEPGNGEIMRIADPFIVPIIRGELVDSVVLMSISLDVATGDVQRARTHEPRLRNAFLQVMFDHSNVGGFDGVFTRNSNMNTLRISLREAAWQILGPVVSEVLITDLVRQDAQRGGF
jgi:flagellar FliL protein